MKETCRSRLSKTLLPPLGLLTVAALLPPDWELRLVDLNVRAVSDEEWQWADLVLLTAMIVQQESLFHLIREAKDRGKKVVTGGPYPTSAPDPILEAGSDFLVKGEGEITIPMLVDAIERGEAGAVIEKVERPDMTGSPVPRFDLLNFRDYVGMALQTARGCPFDCEFCDIINLFGRSARHKTPDQVIEELERLFRLGWWGTVFVSDDNFIGSRKHARDLLEILIPWSKRHGEPFDFWTQVSVNLGRDPEIIDLMTAANFSHVFVGIETPDEEVLKRNRKFQNIWNPLVDSMRTINENGLSIMGSFVIGFDDEQKGAGERICAFVQETNIPMVMLNTLQATPNTRLWDRLKAEGRLLEDKTSGQSTGGRLNFVPTRPESEIRREFADAWDYLYEPSRYLARCYRYYLNMRPTRSAQGLEPETGAPRERPGILDRLRLIRHSVRGVLLILWWYCVRYRTARQFVKQLVSIRKRKPSRLVSYLNSCGLGISMIQLRSSIRAGAEGIGQDRDSHSPSAVKSTAAPISTQRGMKA